MSNGTTLTINKCSLNKKTISVFGTPSAVLLKV